MNLKLMSSKTYMEIFVAFFIIVKMSKQLKILQIVNASKAVSLYNGIVFSHKNKWQTHATVWTNLIMMLTESNQMQKTVYYVIMFI